jgi:predicted SAM-dependent methyltransferase
VPAIREWHQLIKSARNNGYLTSEREYKQELINHLKATQYIFEKAIEKGKEELLLEIGAEECISYAASELVHSKHDYYCPSCNNNLLYFEPLPDHFDSPLLTKYEFEMYNKETFLCPKCSAMDRERLYRLYIEQETKLLKMPIRLLHIAPERNIQNWLFNFDNIDYTGGDLFPTDTALVRVDVTDIHYRDETFDVVMCSHVLEHVPDDRKAMRELYRVLKKGGWGILQVPLAVDITESYEDFSITTPEGRFEAFGQNDHVRVYAQQDYINRLKEVGFEVELYNYATKYGLNEAKKYGLSKNDNLYVVHKK